jgi:Zn-dependent protease/CBS domain-containing protein
MATDSGRAGTTQRGTDSGWSLQIATVAGIPIRLHFTFLLLLLWFGALAGGLSGSGRWQGFAYVVALFACVVLHELGHSLMARRFGIATKEIVLYPIGGVARIEKMPTPRQELWIALAGPAVNAVIAVVIFAVLSATAQVGALSDLRPGTGSLLQLILVANVVLGLFNLIPAFPMDGGRVLRALLALRMGEVRATELAASIGQVLAMVAGFFALLHMHIGLLFIAFFVFLGAGQEATMYRTRAALEGLKARMAMISDFRTLPVSATLRDAASMLLDTHQQDFPVMQGEELLGLLSRQDLLRGLAHSGPGAYVTGAMDREPVRVAPDADLESVAREMQERQRSCALVMENGALRGMLTAENLNEFLVVRQLLTRDPAGRG